MADTSIKLSGTYDSIEAYRILEEIREIGSDFEDVKEEAEAAVSTATSASTAATNASNAANTAANNAQTYAGNANNSATAAAGSASTASTAATNAANSETNASNKANAAAASATAAATSETNAGNSATAAAASATAAAASESIASGSATSAASNASAASNSATEAANSATNAAISDSSATATAAALTAYLDTKETLTAPAVDATLTISGAAADAKVTGDKITENENSLNRLSELVLTDSSESETGSYTLGKYRNSAGTLKNDSACAISSARSVYTRKALTMNNAGYEFGVNCYSSTTVSGEYRIGTYGWYKAGTVFCFPKGTKQLTIQLHKLDGTAITNDDIATVKPSIECYVPTDKTLSVEWAAADAKATGDNIDKTNTNINNLSNFILNKRDYVYGGVYHLGKYREIGAHLLINETGYAITEGINAKTNKINAVVLQDSNYQLGLSCYTNRPLDSDKLIDGTFGWFEADTMFYLPKETGVFTVQVHKLDGTAVTDEDMENVLPSIEFYGLTNETESKDIRILALGDSICRGGRNKSKGFVGDLGLPYINMGVGGATISSKRSTYGDSIHQFPEADTIPNQLTSYYNRSAEDIQTAFGKEKFVPDVIIADGGINDYIYTAPMGTMSNAPASTDEEAALLDTATLIGGLEYLFYQMIKLYHMAQRYFVITHKTGRPNGDYYPTRKSGANYTQQEMHDAIVACCHLYGVIPVDVYQGGIMDTKYSQYRTTADNYTNAEPTDYCDKDGVHPLAYGYQQVYVPLIKTKLSNATRKDDAEDE